MIEPWSETKAWALKAIARIKASYLTRNQKARQIKVLRRTVHWGRR